MTSASLISLKVALISWDVFEGATQRIQFRICDDCLVKPRRFAKIWEACSWRWVEWTWARGACTLGRVTVGRLVGWWNGATMENPVNVEMWKTREAPGNDLHSLWILHRRSTFLGKLRSTGCSEFLNPLGFTTDLGISLPVGRWGCTKFLFSIPLRMMHPESLIFLRAITTSQFPDGQYWTPVDGDVSNLSIFGATARPAILWYFPQRSRCLMRTATSYHRRTSCLRYAQDSLKSLLQEIQSGASTLERDDISGKASWRLSNS